MSFYARVFSMAEDYPSRFAICDELLEAGFEFSTFPGKFDEDFDEKDWKYLMLEYDPNHEPIRIERNVKGVDTIFEEEQEEFLEVLKELPYSKEQKKAIEIVKNMVQIYALDIDEDITEEGWDFLETLLDFIADATDGYVQIDEEGIYDKEGELLIEME
ncbi:hypothetical protein [Lutispora thermophila]|uniref:Uncharacterized protein n=1 Tax=Lutispora thermophila DSM 19022 TaxID=1122184 RepID=A0A1M6E971_9FIRM|nr:hypothetical protein [Lutispora thermophila]SHI81900.1 hypothetical protein SAMN02745176_01492 [Lutispora thermophila DSM 19022]